MASTGSSWSTTIRTSEGRTDHRAFCHRRTRKRGVNVRKTENPLATCLWYRGHGPGLVCPATRSGRSWGCQRGEAVDASGHVEAVGIAGGGHGAVRGVRCGPGGAIRCVARPGAPGARRRRGARRGPDQLRRGHGEAGPRAAGAGRERQHRPHPGVRDHRGGRVRSYRAPRQRPRRPVGRRRPRRRHHRRAGPSQARRRCGRRRRRPHLVREGRRTPRDPRSGGGQAARPRHPAAGPRRPPEQGGAVPAGASPGRVALRRAQGARRPRRQDAQLRRCLGGRLHRRGLDRGRARRRHRLRPPRPDRHVAGLVRPHRCPGRLERLAQGLRPVRRAPVVGGAQPDRPGPVLVCHHQGRRLPGRPPTSTCTANFATKTGPSRNFAAPAGTNTHTYGFRSAWTKSGTVHLGSHPDDHLLQLYGERPAFLVTDPNTAGVYDTVYVDLDNDYRFDDEKPVTKASPASYRDVNGDGFTDMSGGLLYYVSDGATPIPGGLAAFGVLANSFGTGERLAWSGDFDPAIEGHGTLTASNVVAQGVVNGLAPKFSDLPTASHTYPGAVIGGAPDARLAPFGDIYFSFAFSTQLGYFLSTRRGIDVTSNSYGSSNVDNDGWDAASQEADVIHSNQRTTPLFSTGNGAPGFGTVTPPSPAAAIRVGASTQFGGTGWDSVDRISQVTDDDVMVWSNRGPGANATPGVDVVADGAFSSGDTTLNTILDGRNAWVTWGGTSRSTPVAVSATALVYEARRKAGGAITPGFYNTAKNILKSSAKDFGYDSMIQGAGSVDAGKATLTAAGGRATVSPNEWRVGDYRGEEFPVFAHTIAPGGSDSQTFTLNGPGTWQVSDRQMVRTDSEDFSFSSSQVANEANFNFNAPDYLMDLSDRVGAHHDADLMVVRVNYPREQFDGNVDYDEDQDWRLLTYNWTDINGNGRLWADRDGDGAVDHRDLKTVSNVDGTADIDFKHSEMEKGEYVRFMYHRPGANTLMSFVRDPAERMADGLFLGLQHTTHNNAVPVTDFDVQIDWYSNADWDWVSTPASASGSFDASINVPADTPYGMYSGAIVLTNGTDSMAVPVEVAVAATVPQGPDGSIAGALTFGGGDVAEAQADLLYNNGSVFGANDWTWRAESGDWRFFYMDVPQEPPPGSLFLTQTSWDGTAPFTDIDTLLMGRSENSFQVVGDQVFGAPYIIDTVGGSPNTNTGAGVWRFDTASGGSS